MIQWLNNPIAVNIADTPLSTAAKRFAPATRCIAFIWGSQAGMTASANPPAGGSTTTEADLYQNHDAPKALTAANKLNSIFMHPFLVRGLQFLPGEPGLRS